jgi:tryptophanyl-tRNA synthetase
MGITTDSRPMEESKDPVGDHLFTLYSLFASEDQIKTLAETYRRGGFGYGSIKTELVTLSENFFAAARNRRQELLAKPGEVREVLAAGAATARKKGGEVLRRVKDACGL